MEGNKNTPRALMVFGAPCSGKTTFSEKFAKKFGLAFYDLGEIKEQNGFSDKNLLTIISLIARTKQTFIIEGCLNTERERKEMRNILINAGYTPSLIWIQTDVATIRARLKTKFKNVTEAKKIYDDAINLLEAPNESENAIILSGKHTFETQTRHVVSGLAGLIDAK